MTTRTVRLGEVAAFVSGYAFASERFGETGDLPLARIRDVDRGQSETYYAGPFEEKFVIGNGDLLIAMDGDFRVGYWRGGQALLNQRVCRAIPEESDLDLQYLGYALPRELQRIQDRTSFVTVKHLSVKQLRALKIPLPPLPEQRRIAAILDKADAVRRKRQQTLDLADQFLRSAFLDLFGDPVTNPKGWPVKKLGDVLVDIEGGWSAKGEDRTPQPGEKAVLKISAVTSGTYRPGECKVVTDLGGRDVITPRLGDVLFSRANTRELVAATCLVDREAPDVFLPDKLWRLVPNDEMIQGVYLRYALSSESLRSLVRRRATGTSGSMLNVSKAKLRSIPIPVPDLKQQERFGQIWRSQQSLLRNVASDAEACAKLQRLELPRFRGQCSA